MKNKVFAIIIALSFSGKTYLYSSSGLSLECMSSPLSVAMSSAGIASGKLLGPSSAASCEEAANKAKAKEGVARYMKQKHSILVRDIIAGRGPLITECEAHLNLTKTECARFESHLIDSEEQSRMIKVVEGEIDLRNSEVFAVSFTGVLRYAIGKECFQSILEKSSV